MRQLKITNSVTARTEILEKYMRDIMSFRLVTPEEETELAMKIRDGDKEASKKLVEANLRFVISVAKQYQNLGLTLPDLINEGNIGLIKAARLFDPTRGMKFITYAVWWIRQQIIQSISQLGRTIRIPINKSGLASKISREHDKLEQTLNREPTVEEIAKTMGLTVDMVQSTISCSAKSLSLDMPTGEDGEVTMMDYLPDTSTTMADTFNDKKEMHDDIDIVLNILSEREKMVIKMFFGIDSQEYSLDDIAVYTGLSSERVRQLKDKALKKLRQSSAIETLLQYI